MRLSPETHPIIQAHEPVLDGSLATCDYISLKNAKGVLITVSWTYVAAANLVLTVLQATNIAAGSAVALTTGAEFPIWVNTDTATSDAMVRQTDAVTYSILHAGTKNQLVAMYIDASILSAGFDCVALHSTTGGTGIVSVLYQLDGARYQQTTPPTAITN